MQPTGFESPAWRVAVGTGVGYGLALVVLFVVLFALPYLLFLAL